MTKSKKAIFFAALAVGLLAVGATWLFCWSFVEWIIPAYGAAVALMFLAAAGGFGLPAYAKTGSVKKAVIRAALGGAVYIAVIEAMTYLINNILLGGNRPWVAATAVSCVNCVLFIVLWLLLVRAAGAPRKALNGVLAFLLGACVLLGGVGTVKETIMNMIFKDIRLAAPTGFSAAAENAPEKVTDADFYVSPAGDDKNDGSFASPFATVERAQQAVRETDKTGKNGVTVAVMAGEYRVQSLRFTAEDGGTADCPVTYCAYGDGEVVINGGVTIQPGAFAPVTDEGTLSRLKGDAKTHVVCADLGVLGITAADYGKIYAIGSYNTAYKYTGDYTGPIYAELFVNDTRYNLARYPDSGWLETGEVVQPGNGLESNGSLTRNENWGETVDPQSDVYKIDDALAERIRGWQTLDDVWMLGFWKYTWADGSSPVGEFDYENRTISPKFVSLYGAIKGAPYCFFNVFEELDAPGEWYLDRQNNVLYLYAPDDMENAQIDLSLSTETLVAVEGAEHLTLRGFTLKGTRGDGVRAAGNKVTVERCLIKNIAGTAIIMDGYRNLAANNEITRTGKGGIHITGGDKTTLTPGESRAYNNLIHDWSEIYLTYQPALDLGGVGNKADHNEMYNSPHEAITYDGNNNVMEYNVIHDVCLLSDDAGAVYAGRNWVSYGCVVRYNLIYNLGTPGEHYPQGIYMDDALSGQTIYGNLLVNVPCLGIQLGGGRDLDVRNNIVINSGRYAVEYDQRAIDGVHGGWFGHCDEMWAQLEASAWRSDVWQAAYPQYHGLHFDEANEDDKMYAPNAACSVVSGNLFVNAKAESGNYSDNPRDFSDISGNAAYSLTALKKLFTDPGNGDYTLRDNAPVFDEIPGFERLPVEKMGRE